MGQETDREPFHMQELDDNVAVLPKDADIPPEYEPEHSTVVDIGSIQTNPMTEYAEYKSTGKGLASTARVLPDGRIVISLDLKKKLPDLPEGHAQDIQEFAVDKTEWRRYPSMNIVIMIVGSRGDVQPYVALGKLLLADGHRVRIASHETFRTFVNEAGLEFFNIGGNPQDLMSYMVKNPGLMPGMTSLTNGDISRKRKMLTEMINGCWLSCHSPCQETGRTFAADAIISNPPAFAHVHCAEALGIPLLLSFTMPWSPTASFPHPLVNIKSSNAENGLTNYLSYALADIMTWQGIGDLVNNFRTRTLGLEPLSLRSGPSLVDRVKIPWTYCMSPALVPKPNDWKNYIDVVGFYFLDLATSYTPPDDLAAFLAAGEPPVYIGFGSVVVDDAEAMTKTIFAATAQAGVRALVSAGWGGLGGTSIPSHIFILGNVPHDWLFDKERVSAVVHHGGAGTTAVGLEKGRPTVVVPFFGDQGFWGSMIHKAGAGPKPIPHKKLNIDNLRDALKFAISPAAKNAAKGMAEQIQREDGVRKGVDSFYRHLPLLNMRCDVDPSRLAVWWSTEYCLKLSAFAAQVLIDAKLLEVASLDLHRTKEYDTRKQVSDPVTGGASAIYWTVTHWYAGIARIFYSPVKGIIKTTTAIPRGVMDIVSSVREGFYNTPKLYGSKVRKTGKVTSFASGLKEGGKGLFYGYYDGITGLVREPYEGAQKEGFIGAVKGSLRSFANATIRPAGGIVGLIAHPVRGLWKSVQSPMARKQEQQQHQVRIADGVEAVQRSTQTQRSEVVQKFKQLQAGTKERQKRYKDIAEAEMYEEQSSVKDGEAVPTSPQSTSASSQPTSTDSQPNSTPSTPQQTEEDEDVAFERDMEKAKELSLAEQRGYERAMAQMNRHDSTT
ncbi:UDP-Glycosyltransferase/glycogen phosphorylase [Mycena maculata]|uniref:UDP-Glycosyltransferase/glycogen phosphorylase n=1 Tax=Mycena maculata TaxID=230809 RepID=A0AAD7K5G6_9AGAR|nr:UDP-Glycosyltransferase/glycogen phosphorylase [Mycena maculata]